MKDREPMESLATLRHELHNTEERLLTKLRSLRRDLRRTQAQPGQDGTRMASAELTTGQRIADQVAATMGSWKFIIIQSIILLAWIALNVTAFVEQWDPYPFILLNLAFSTQAAYAAPLILLAQNRQENRDRVALEEDRRRAAQTKADTEYLARELAALRLAVGEVVTREYLRHELEDLRTMLARLQPEGADGEAVGASDDWERTAKKSR